VIGDKLRELRKERKLTQEEMCKLLDIKQGTYAGYESNKHLPDLLMIIKIADIFKVSLDYIADRYKQ
jgi:transcriptional regulator with XRE-family HTH domain